MERTRARGSMRNLLSTYSISFMRKTILLFVLGLYVTLSLAQEAEMRIRFEHLTVANGLPVNAVFSILQDHLGFIWLGSLREDGNGDIWIGSKSLFRFERATGRFIEYPDKFSIVNNSFPFIRFVR